MEGFIPNEKDFNLSKVKLSKAGGIQVEYQLTQVVGEETSVVDRKETCTRDVHPDLLALFEDLRIIVGRTFGITSFLTLVESADFNLSEAKRLQARQFADELLQKIEVRGVSWSGTAESIGVVITAILETTNGLKSALNTPRIKLAQISFGFEEELEQITDAIRGEVFAYLFKGKQAQLSLFGGESEGEQE